MSNETTVDGRHIRDTTQKTGTAPVKAVVTIEAPAVLLLDTPEDRERLIAAIEASWPDLLAPLGGQAEGLGRSADAIIAALRGER